MTVYPHLLQYNHIFILQLDDSISTSFSVYPHLCQYIHIYLEYIHIFLGRTLLVPKVAIATENTIDIKQEITSSKISTKYGMATISLENSY